MRYEDEGVPYYKGLCDGTVDCHYHYCCYLFLQYFTEGSVFVTINIIITIIVLVAILNDKFYVTPATWLENTQKVQALETLRMITWTITKRKEETLVATIPHHFKLGPVAFEASGNRVVGCFLVTVLRCESLWTTKHSSIRAADVTPPAEHSCWYDTSSFIESWTINTNSSNSGYQHNH